MKIAIFGGTFDPIHNGHLQIAAAAADRFHLDRILFVPAAHPPHKLGQQSAPYDDRLHMVELACAADQRFEASAIEAGSAKSYSIVTIERVKSQLDPADELYFLIGADAFADVETWHRWRELASQVTFIVVSRPGFSFDVPEGFRVQPLDDVRLPMSSTAIRARLAEGRADVPAPGAVLDYIRRRGLYGVASDRALRA